MLSLHPSPPLPPQNKCTRMEHWRKLSRLAVVVSLVSLFASFSSSSASFRSFHRSDEHSLMNWKTLADEGAPAVRLTQGDQQVTVDNGLFAVTFSVPEGMINVIQYKGISNMLSEKADINARMYFDAVWEGGRGFKILSSSYNVTVQTEDQVELSFTYTWDLNNSSKLPLNVDKRYVVLRGISGIYIYGVYERLQGWPDLNFVQTRIVFRPDVDKFTYMALTDERQRVMPSAEDREDGKTLDYKEAVKLINTSNPDLQGEVDDKYQYSAQYKDSRVHGWISDDQAVGIWMITPSNEFKNGGPTRQRMHSHVGPTMLNVLTCTHYAGPDLEMKFRNGEPWKKVYGPLLVYLNSGDRASAWSDAKNQMLAEVGKWPYDFPSSKDYLKSSERGTVSGVLRVHDGFVQSGSIVGASKAQVGLAAPGEAGSWQRESKGYQFWVEADEQGNFVINNILPGTYNIYAFVPGVIGDYVYDNIVTVASGDNIRLGVLTYEPPRDGPTIWEIGIPDRSAAELYIPDPDPDLRNYLYDTLRDQKFRQYGLWRRYSELHPDEDITYTINQNNYSTDWFFAQVTRNTEDNQYTPTTWKVNFLLDDVKNASSYKLRIALASMHATELHVRVNDPNAEPPNFKTGQIGRENAIARHGVHGLYWLFNIDVPGEKLVKGNNTIFLTQSIGTTPFQGIMYDYIRFEGPCSRIYLRKKVRYA